MSSERLAIGELAARLGISVPLLRVWEQRYGVIEPTRTAGGARRYTLQDELRLRAMVAMVQRGVTAGEAARALLTEATGALGLREEPALAVYRRQLEDGCRTFDEPGVQDALDRLLAAFDVRAVLGEVVLPFLRQLGERWEQGEATVAEEHFASTLIRSRLLGLARGWGHGVGRTALLACAPGELHDIGLIAFGIALRQAGWRIVFLGPDTPLEAIEQAADGVEADVAVVSAVTPALLDDARRNLRLPPTVSLALGGRGAVAGAADGPGYLLPADALEAATAVARDEARSGSRKER
jgi:MerR family transcriptional regulator, light-induced transcriptional regulator